MKKLLRFARNLLLTATICNILPVHATAVDVSSPRPVIPPNVITSSNRPMIMLAASKDQSLFGPIYTDFEDLDGDGVIDTTFIPTFKYYGYFDSTKCYAYSSTNGQFEPAALATAVSGTKTTVVGTVSTVVATARYTCPSNQSYWSGNFLNWSSMTRLDVVRKMLYGGTRSTDSSTSTVLQLSKLNFDAHSFVKYYNGLDIRDYTPFTTTALTKTTGSNPNIYAGLSICITGSADNSTTTTNPPVMRMVKGNVRFWATVELVVCRWKDDDNYSSGTFGPKLARYYKNNSDPIAATTPYVVAHELTIPSVANDGATYTGSSSTIGPQLTLRVKVCDASLLGEERCQAFPPNSTTNFKPYGLFQEFGYSSTGGAARAEFGVITGSYDQNYTAGALRKNMGDFSDEINSTTGIFCHSSSAGCATSGNGAIRSFDDIILNDRVSQRYTSAGNPSGVAEGSLSSWGNPMGEMLVQVLQYYAYNGSTPASSNPTVTLKDASVGMPVVAWSDPLSNSNATRKSLYGNAICRPLNTLLLSSSALSFDNQAATPFTTLVNRTGDINSYTNTVGTTEGLNGTLRSVGSVTGGYGDSCSAKTVGLLSDVSGICPEAPGMGGTYQVAGAALYGNTSKIRTIASPPSDLATVKDALKVKTLAASLTGGSPRIDIPIPGTSPVKYVYVTPESVQSGGNVSAPLTFASISSGSTYGSFVVTWNDILMGGDYDMDIVGFLRYDLIANSTSPNGWDIKITTDIPGMCGGGAGTHGFSIIGVTNSLNASANGRYLTHQNFSDTLTGMPSPDYFCGDTTYRDLSSATGLSTTYRNIALSSPAFSGTYGNTVCKLANGTSGTVATGDPAIPNLIFYCTAKNIDYPVSLTFKMVGAENALIKDPLFYAAKYGDFDSSTKKTDGSNTYTEVALPLTTSSWDKFKSDGSIGSDGIPDGYFLARRPDLLEDQLRKALDSLAKNANSAPATTSGQLAAGNYKYVAKFDSTTVTGNIDAYVVQANGQFATNPTWEAGQSLQIRASTDYVLPQRPGDSRQIITNSGNKSTTNTTAGVSFRWANLPAAYVAQMTTASTNKLSATNAEIALNYIRGDQTLENASTGLRVRGDNLLGPVVNATPWVQSPPSANYLENQFVGYGAYATAQKDRAKLLWVAANDGMLHAFNPDTGAELFAYVPGTLANRLAEIPLQRGTTGRTRLNGSNFTLDSTETQPDSTVWAYVDGSPFTADVKTNIVPAVTVGSVTTPETGTWKTYAFSSLGRGGRGLFALDATDLSALGAAEGGTTPNSIFRWQFTSDDDADLGYLVNDISLNNNSGQASPVVRLNNGKFGLLLGNGYRSTSGKAVLFILFIDGPTLAEGWTGQYVKITADAGTGNGLMNPTWIDRDNDGTADVVYAGDLKGNMWKFDISDKTTTATWDVAYKGTGTPATNRPLFTAQNTTTVGGVTTVTALPITAAPEYVYPAFDGLIINFGTGIALETGNFPNTAVPERFYGVWDRPSFTTTAATGTGPMIKADMSTLVTRTYARNTSSGIVTATPTVATVNGVSTSTYTAIDWTSNDGWYFNFPGALPPPNTPNLSEMLLSAPDLQAGFLIFPTVRAKIVGDTCSSTPDVTLYVIDPIAGIPTRTAQGITSDGTLIAGTPAQDQKWVTVSNRTDAPWTTTCTAAEAGCTNVVNGIGTKAAACAPGNKVASPQSASENRTLCYNPLGRVQWREIPGLRTDQ